MKPSSTRFWYLRKTSTFRAPEEGEEEEEGGEAEEGEEAKPRRDRPPPPAEPERDPESMTEAERAMLVSIRWITQHCYASHLHSILLFY